MNRLGKKYTNAIPVDVLKKEDKLQTLEVTKNKLQERQIEHLTQMIAALNVMKNPGTVNNFMKEKAQAIILSSRWFRKMEEKNLHFASDDWDHLKTAYVHQLGQVMNSLEKESIDEEFIQNWVMWIQGYTECPHVLLKTWWWWAKEVTQQQIDVALRDGFTPKQILNTESLCKPVERRRLFGKEFDVYLEEFVARKYDFQLDMLKLRAFIPRNLDTSWKFWKYVVEEFKMLETDYMTGYFDPFLPGPKPGDDQNFFGKIDPKPPHDSGFPLDFDLGKPDAKMGMTRQEESEKMIDEEIEAPTSSTTVVINPLMKKMSDNLKEMLNFQRGAFEREEIEARVRSLGSWMDETLGPGGDVNETARNLVSIREQIQSNLDDVLRASSFAQKRFGMEPHQLGELAKHYRGLRDIIPDRNGNADLAKMYKMKTKLMGAARINNHAAVENLLARQGGILEGILGEVQTASQNHEKRMTERKEDEIRKLKEAEKNLRIPGTKFEDIKKEIKTEDEGGHERLKRIQEDHNKLIAEIKNKKFQKIVDIEKHLQDLKGGKTLDAKFDILINDLKRSELRREEYRARKEIKSEKEAKALEGYFKTARASLEENIKGVKNEQEATRYAIEEQTRQAEARQREQRELRDKIEKLKNERTKSDEATKNLQKELERLEQRIKDAKKKDDKADVKKEKIKEEEIKQEIKDEKDRNIKRELKQEKRTQKLSKRQEEDKKLLENQYALLDEKAKLLLAAKDLEYQQREGQLRIDLLEDYIRRITPLIPLRNEGAMEEGGEIAATIPEAPFGRIYPDFHGERPPPLFKKEEVKKEEPKSEKEEATEDVVESWEERDETQEEEAERLLAEEMGGQANLNSIRTALAQQLEEFRRVYIDSYNQEALMPTVPDSDLTRLISETQNTIRQSLQSGDATLLMSSLREEERLLSLQMLRFAEGKDTNSLILYNQFMKNLRDILASDPYLTRNTEGNIRRENDRVRQELTVLLHRNGRTFSRDYFDYYDNEIQTSTLLDQLVSNREIDTPQQRTVRDMAISANVNPDLRNAMTAFGGSWLSDHVSEIVRFSVIELDNAMRSGTISLRQVFYILAQSSLPQMLHTAQRLLHQSTQNSWLSPFKRSAARWTAKP